MGWAYGWFGRPKDTVEESTERAVQCYQPGKNSSKYPVKLTWNENQEKNKWKIRVRSKSTLEHLLYR